MQLIGVDVGGTFTDLIFTDTDRDVTLIHKVPTTPDDPSVGAIAGLRELCARHDLDPAAIDRGAEYATRDVPGDGSRYVRDAEGIDTVIVGGAVAWSAAEGYTGARRGALLPGAAS